jgi:hypothetical protein
MKLFIMYGTEFVASVLKRSFFYLAIVTRNKEEKSDGERMSSKFAIIVFLIVHFNYIFETPVVIKNKKLAIYSNKL